MLFVLMAGIAYFGTFTNVSAQQPYESLKGKVTETIENQKVAVPGANIFYRDTLVGTTTNDQGEFSLPRIDGFNYLVISYVSYKNDTVFIAGRNYVEVNLSNNLDIAEVEIVHRDRGINISMIDPIKVEGISSTELKKAACCNLSESFETNPSVDVSFTDAVTGTRQIEMLGLAGPYIQLTRENMPNVRGLMSVYGLSLIPGPWIESIHLNKGTGSVVNGFESIAGQIDVNLRNPANMDKLYLNLFANEGGRFEANANFKKEISHQLSTGLLLHAKANNTKHDRNKDGFLDKPIGNQLIAVNRWEYNSEQGVHFQQGIKATYD
ncbi:MAG: TonB-dependent receptor [Bacteroidales bacterium]|nr:TonB-dependent receptor [Bacteroidales bacterium]